MKTEVQKYIYEIPSNRKIKTVFKKKNFGKVQRVKTYLNKNLHCKHIFIQNICFIINVYKLDE